MASVRTPTTATRSLKGRCFQRQEAGHFHEKKNFSRSPNFKVYTSLSTSKKKFFFWFPRMLASCTLPWTKSTSSSVEVDSTLVENDCDDSAFHEPEYSNPASYESGISGSGISGSGSPDCSHRTDQNASDYQNHSMIRRQMNRLNINDEDFIPDYEEVDPVQGMFIVEYH